MKFSILFLIFLFSVSAFAQKTDNKNSAQIADAYFCDLIEKPTDFAGKTIRVKAAFEIYSGEPRIFCGDCLDIEAISIKFADDFEKATKKNYRQRLKEKAISNVIFVGKLSTGEFGKDKQYTKQFVVESAEFAEILNDKPGNLTVRMQAKFFCQKKD